MVGLETRHARATEVRAEWQLYELDTGELHRCPPKDESRRTIAVPAWLARLLMDHVERTRPAPCPCHNLRYVFSGHRPANSSAQIPGPSMVDVARRAGFATWLFHPAATGAVPAEGAPTGPAGAGAR